jgi:MEDS: MEthanogen/methylotroph, DcmR Sensory domain
MDRLTARFPGRRIRAFGEMVDLLCADGNADGAIDLEALWNGLAAARDFSLLCGYHLDVFDRASQASVLPEICRAHSHVRPADDPERLRFAVDQALEDTLGKDAGKVYALIGSEIRGSRVPTAQLALMWVSENMPGSAERILASARSHYLAAETHS